MQTDVESVSPDMGLVDLERKFLALGRSGFPVVEQGRLVGIVSRSDVVRMLSVERAAEEQLADFYRAFEDPSQASTNEKLETAAVAARVGERAAALAVRDAMIHRVVSVERNQPLSEVARMMVAGHLHRLPVLDDGKLIGLVSTLDIVRLLAQGRLFDGHTDGAAELLLGAGTNDADRLSESRAALEASLERLTSRTNAIETDLRSAHDRDSQERATERENDEVLERLGASERGHVAQIRRALARIEAGEYETCEACGEPVGRARQVALPEATRCLGCA